MSYQKILVITTYKLEIYDFKNIIKVFKIKSSSNIYLALK